jgi:hypothetical protein
MASKKMPGLAIAIMSKAKKPKSDDYEDEMEETAFSDASSEVMSAINSGDKEGFAKSLKNAIRICMKDY